MKNHKLLSIFLVLCLFLLPAALCQVVGDNGCPNGSYPVMVNGNRVCQVSGANTSPTPISPGFGNLGEMLGK